jgi:hypothetical protein
MATEKQTVILVETLMFAYPAFKTESPRELLDLYVAKLKDFDHEALKQAVDAHIDSSRYFPSLHEIIAHAKKWRPSGIVFKNDLRQQMLMLEDLFYQSGQITESSWRDLVTAFDQAGRQHSAIHAREKYEQLTGQPLQVEIRLELADALQ